MLVARRFIGKREKRPSDKLYVLWGGLVGCLKRSLCSHREEVEEEEEKNKAFNLSDSLDGEGSLLLHNAL